MWTRAKRVDAGKVLHSFRHTENPWTVLDPTVNMVSRVDDLKLLSADHSRKRGHDGALDPACLQER